MSALTDQWLLVHAASVAAESMALAIASAEDEGDSLQRSKRVAAFQAAQAAQIADLDTKLQNLITLWVMPGS
jgi:hypothetical protein